MRFSTLTSLYLATMGKSRKAAKGKTTNGKSVAKSNAKPKAKPVAKGTKTKPTAKGKLIEEWWNLDILRDQKENIGAATLQGRAKLEKMIGNGNIFTSCALPAHTPTH